MSPFSNSRQAGESAVEYRVRRRTINKGIAAHLKGRRLIGWELQHRPKLGKAATKAAKRAKQAARKLKEVKA